MAKKKLPRGIDRLKSGRFRVRVSHLGRRRQQLFDLLEDAVEFKRVFELDAAHRKHGLPPLIRRRPVLAVVIERFRKDGDQRVIAGTLADSTLTSYYQRTDGILGWLEDRGTPGMFAEELDDHLIAEYVHWRIGRPLTKKARRAPTDVMTRKDLALLSRIYRWAGIERRWTIPRNLRRSHGGKRVLEPAKFFAFLDAMEKASLERTVGELALSTGLRFANIRALQLEEIDFSDRVIRTTSAKTRRPLTVAFSEDLADHLRAWLKNRKPAVTRLLFHLDARPLQPGSLRRRFRAASKAAGIDPPIEYIGGARNAFIAYLLESGVHVEDVAAFVGHSDPRVTLGYSKAYLPLAALRRVADKIARLRRGD